MGKAMALMNNKGGVKQSKHERALEKKWKDKQRKNTQFNRTTKGYKPKKKDGI